MDGWPAEFSGKRLGWAVLKMKQNHFDADRGMRSTVTSTSLRRKKL
jgi:hypothetical protein